MQALAPLLKIRRVLKDLVLLFKAFELANYAWLTHSGDKEKGGKCLGEKVQEHSQSSRMKARHTNFGGRVNGGCRAMVRAPAL